MNNTLSNLTVIVLTYKTDLEILKNCIKSIDTTVNINLIENSVELKDKKKIKDLNPNINFFCTGENLGYGMGNNFGLKNTKTRYALILNPDVVCAPDFFKNILKYTNEQIDFTIIGAQYNDNSQWKPFGYFEENKKKPNPSSDDLDLIEADWVIGCSMLIDLNKFENKNIFDKNYFLFFEEFDLCKQIKKSGQKIYSSKSLKIDHLGFSGSFATKKEYKIEALKIRNWHFMWSFFYYHKKNDGYFYAIKKTLGNLIKSFFKTLYYTLTFNNHEKTRYHYRFLGLLNSIIGKKSWFRINF